MGQALIDAAQPRVAARAAAFCDRLADRSPGQVVDLQAQMRTLAVEIACAELLGDAALAGDAQLLSDLDAIWTYLGDHTNPVERALSPTAPLFRRRLSRLRAAIEARVARLRRQRDPEPGLLSGLAAQSDLSDRDLRDECMTLLFTAHECTALSAATTLFFAAADSAIWSELAAEVRASCGDTSVTTGGLRELAFARCVFNEALRLCPPGWVFARQLQAPFEVGDVTLPRDAIVLVSPYVVHHDAGLWPDPERFDPLRFDPARRGERSPIAFLPFGTGPRACVGAALATMQALTIAATVASRFDLRATGSAAPLDNPGLTLRMRDGLPVTVRAAEASARPGPTR